MRPLVILLIASVAGLALAPAATAASVSGTTAASDVDSARPPLIEVYPCFRDGTFYIVIAGIVETGCLPPFFTEQAASAELPEPVQIYPCFRPGTFIVIILERYSTGCIGLPP